MSSGRLTLVCASSRHAAEPTFGESIDTGPAGIASFAGGLETRANRSVLVSPSVHARGLATALGLDASFEQALAACSFGRWSGQRMRDVADAEPKAFASWLADPTSAPHGGETISSVSERVASWLVPLGAESGAWIAFTHHEVVRVAVLHVLGAPLAAFARVDVGPGAFVDVTWHRGQYRLRM
jgi:broad specificity phosphatase PhoE